MIHRLCDRRDLAQPLHREVVAELHHADDNSKLLKLIGFRRSQWVRFEKRNDAVQQVGKGSDVESPEILPMVVVPAVDADAAASEEALQLVQDMHAPLSLNHRELGLDLPPQATRAVAEDRNTEAPLAVDEADDPLLGTWPFLLIARTGRIVTAHISTLRRGCDMNEYRRILGVSSI